MLFLRTHSAPLQSCSIEFVGTSCDCPLKECGYPINQAIHHGSRNTVDDHRTCDGEHFCADAKDKTLGFELHCRAATEFAKPVMGTKVPAPAYLAILS